MDRILVTGGAGYIGAQTCKLLATKGYEPVCYDNFSTGHRRYVRWGPLVEGALHDTSRLAAALDEYRPVAVIHFAASAYVGESVRDPFRYYENNVGGTLSLLRAMQESETRSIVFSSTCATYGIPDAKKIDECHAQQPVNPYGRSKLMIEQVLADLASRNVIAQLSLRYFNAAGADKDGELGEDHDPETHLIPLAIRSAMGGDPIHVFGTDYDTRDGTAIRDYTHVEDLARAHLASVEYLLEGGQSDAVNLGTGSGHSVREVIAALRALDLDIQAVDDERRPGDSAELVAEVAKAHTLLDWEPHYRSLEEILQSAVRWHTGNG